MCPRFEARGAEATRRVGRGITIVAMGMEGMLQCSPSLKQGVRDFTLRRKQEDASSGCDWWRRKKTIVDEF